MWNHPTKFGEQRWGLPGGIDPRKEAVEIGRLGTRATQEVNDYADERAAQGESESDP